MAYEGDRLFYCPAVMFDFSHTWVVIVSGITPFGHMLLNTGGRGGRYFQVAGGLDHVPLFMDERGYQRYLKEEHKTEIRRFRVHIPHPEKSEAKLEDLLSKRWLWLGPVHNCEELVEEIIVAGGGPRLHTGEMLLPKWASPHY